MTTPSEVMGEVLPEPVESDDHAPSPEAMGLIVAEVLPEPADFDRMVGAPRKAPRCEPFFPDFLFKEALVALAAFVVLLLIIVYYKAPLEAKADPADTSYQPRPEWYFLFLFQLLKYFPGSLEPVATVVLPGAFITALILLPFYDRRPERRPSRRPVAVYAAIGTLSLVGGLTVISVRSLPASAPQSTVSAQKLGPFESEGRALYKSVGCGGCHSINGAGGTNAPDLSHVGANRDPEWLHSYIENPKTLNPDTRMPGFLGKMSHMGVEKIARYLATQK